MAEPSEINIYCTIKENKRLENIIDESIEEFKDIESKKDFKEYKDMSEEDVLIIRKELLSVREEVIENRSASSKSESKILEVAEENKVGISKIDAKYNKTTYALFTIFFLLGTLVGLQDEFWKPYISDILNGAKALATWGR